MSANGDWMRLRDETDAPSPALLVYPDRVEANLRQMIAMVGDPARLRPHIKTTKLPPIVERQVALGITKCKTATIAETEMAARAGVREITHAVQLVGPNVARFLALQRSFPQTQFTTVTDDASVIAALSTAAKAAGQTIEVLLDL